MYSATFYITKVLSLIVEACIIEGNTVQLQLIVADQHPKQITWNHLALKKPAEHKDKGYRLYT